MLYTGIYGILLFEENLVHKVAFFFSKMINVISGHVKKTQGLPVRHLNKCTIVKLNSS